MKLIAVGFGGYRVHLKLSRLVNYKLKYLLHLFLVTEITRHTVHV